MLKSVVWHINTVPDAYMSRY